MTTAKHEVSIGLQHENWYVVGVINLVFFFVEEEEGANFQLEKA